jgi:hypothetical protein
MENVLTTFVFGTITLVILFVFYKIFENLTQILSSYSLLLNDLIRILKYFKLKKPGYVFLVQKTEGENGMLKFVLLLPTKSAPDVASRDLVVDIDGQLTTLSLGADVVESPEMMGNDNASVKGSLVDVDDAGNRSEAREFSFTLLDTFPPPQPGEVGVKVTGEDFPVPPAPEPDPVPEV